MSKRIKKSYARAILARAECKIPASILKALVKEGWNVLGVYETVLQAMELTLIKCGHDEALYLNGELCDTGGMYVTEHTVLEAIGGEFEEEFDADWDWYENRNYKFPLKLEDVKRE